MKPILKVDGLQKQYQRGWLQPVPTFRLEASFEIQAPCIVGVMGANGAGKTTLFELMTGGNQPTAGRVLIGDQDIHQIRYDERDRLALHYHQSYQLRRFRRSKPAAMLERARTQRPVVHLFDEPQFNTQDGYIGFMLDFFRSLRERGNVVFLCLHPNDPVHLDILRETCDRFFFLKKDAAGVSRLQFFADMDGLSDSPDVRAYLGRLSELL